MTSSSQRKKNYLGKNGTVMIVGLGMMGGSIAAALKKQKHIDRRVIAYDIHQDSLEWGLEQGIIDQYYLELIEGIEQADIIIFALPITEIKHIFKQLHQSMTDSGMKKKIVTDLSSTKANIISILEEIFGEIPSWFVPGHPIAGSEKRGVFKFNADLFQDREVILTPSTQTDQQALTTIMKLWYSCGATISLMNADQHDRFLAKTSHMPHVLAYLMMQTIEEDPVSGLILRYAGNGLKDFSRIAHSNPNLWRDIILSNRQNIIIEINRLSVSLQILLQHVESNNKEALLHQLEQGYLVRKKFSKFNIIILRR